MKKRWWGLSLVLLVCLGCAWLFLKQQLRNENIVYDDEQQGLKKQIVIYFSHVVAENTPKG